MSNTEAREQTNTPRNDIRVGLPICIFLSLVSVFLSYRILNTNDDWARKEVSAMRTAFERFIVLNNHRMSSADVVDDKQTGNIIINSDSIEQNRRDIDEILNLIMDSDHLKPYIGDGNDY